MSSNNETASGQPIFPNAGPPSRRAIELAAEMHAFVGVLTSAKSEDELKGEINDLSDFASSLPKAFDKVGSIITAGLTTIPVSFELKMYLLNALIEWSGHRQTLNGTLDISKTVAQDAIDTADDFLTDVISNVTREELSMEVRKGYLTAFMSRLNGRDDRARDMAQRFVDLKKDIEGFMKQFEEKLAGYDTVEMERLVRQLDAEINDLLKDLDQVRQTIATLSEKLEVLEAAARATGIFGFLCPAWWIGTAITAAQASAVKEQLNAAKSERNHIVSSVHSKQLQRGDLQADIKAVPLLRSAMKEGKPTFDQITTRIGSLATIWAAFRADTQGIMEKLEYANDTDSKLLFKARVETAGAMYTSLRTALVTYRAG